MEMRSHPYRSPPDTVRFPEPRETRRKEGSAFAFAGVGGFAVLWWMTNSESGELVAAGAAVVLTLILAAKRIVPSAPEF